MPCIQVSLIIGVAIMNSIAAHIKEWPKPYQLINIPHFLMYIAIIYYLCQKEFYTTAWVVFALITLVTVDFIILSDRIFEMEETVMTRIRGGVPPIGAASPCNCGGRSKPCNCVGRSSKCGCGGTSCKCGCASPSTPQPPATTLYPQASQPLSQFTSQPSSAFRLEPGQEIGSYLEAAGYQQPPPLNVTMQPPPINSATVRMI